MKATIDELNTLINTFSQELAEISESVFSAKPLPRKWSKKEVLGHLIDSAENNLRRFVVGQYEKTPPKIVYDQDFWVASKNYQEMESADVISMWKLINQRIVAVLKNMPVDNYTKSCDTGKDTIQLRSLEWLAEDYLKHMKHHLNQIMPGSFSIVYS